MRKSKTPSDYIAVKAMTKSEYDQCNLAVLYLEPDWVENMKSRINDIALVAKDSSFYSLVYWEAPDGYFVLPDDFMFRLDENEFESLISQFATSKRGGRRKLQGVPILLEKGLDLSQTT